MHVRNLPLAAIAAAFFFCVVSTRAQAQVVSSCTSSIRVLIDRYTTNEIPAGSTIWFTSVLQDVQSANGDLNAASVRIDVRHAQITFGKWPYTVDLPDSTTELDPSASDPQRWWVNRSAWRVAFAPSIRSSVPTVGYS